MDYLDRLTNSIDELEKNAFELSRISDLLLAIRELIKVVQEEKDEIKGCKDDNIEICARITKEVEKLEKISDNNEILLQNILNTIREQLIKNKKENIETVESLTTSISGKFSIFETEIESAIKEELLRASKENNDIIKSVKQNVSDKLEIFEKNITSLISNQLYEINAKLSFKIETEREKVEKNITSIVSDILSEQEEKLNLQIETGKKKVEQLIQDVESQKAHADSAKNSIMKLQIGSIAATGIVLFTSIVLHFV